LADLVDADDAVDVVGPAMGLQTIGDGANLAVEFRDAGIEEWRDLAYRFPVDPSICPEFGGATVSDNHGG